MRNLPSGKFRILRGLLYREKTRKPQPMPRQRGICSSRFRVCVVHFDHKVEGITRGSLLTKVNIYVSFCMAHFNAQSRCSLVNSESCVAYFIAKKRGNHNQCRDNSESAPQDSESAWFILITKWRVSLPVACSAFFPQAAQHTANSAAIPKTTFSSK